MSANSVAAVSDSLLSGLKPDTLLTVSEWADEHRYIAVAAVPGKYRTDLTPYLREIMDSLSTSSQVEEVVFMKGAQVGGSEAGNNWVGYIIEHAPGPLMLVQPTDVLAKRYSKQRIDPLISDTPCIAHKVKPNRERDSGNTILQKDYVGGTMIITGANSAVGLRSMPAQYLFLDELDGYPADIDEEGDPVELAEARTRTYKRKRKVFKVSTPKLEGSSRIQAEFEETDQRYYHLPCPHCGEFQPLKWSNIKWEGKDSKTAYYACEHNGCVIEEYHKTKMMALGKWVPKFPGRGGSRKRGYHLNALYSPVSWGFSWAEAVAQFLKAKNKPNLLKVFVNTVLGETWKEKGDAPEWEVLYRRREAYPFNVVPKGAYFLTAGVDVQADRLEFEVVGWGPELESWSIDYRVISGPTSTKGPWGELAKVLGEAWPTEDGVSMGIAMMAVDSGYNTQTVYNWVRNWPINRVVAIKGQESLMRMFGTPSKVDVNINGRSFARGINLWPAGVNVAKQEIYGNLKLQPPLDPLKEPYPPGYCHFPMYDENYFKMLTAEQLVQRRNARTGETWHEWVKKRDRNEALDTRNYARIAAAILGIDRFKPEQWAQLRGNEVKPLDLSLFKNSREEQ